MLQEVLDSTIRFLPEIMLSLFFTGAYIWRQVALHEWRLGNHDTTFIEIKSVLSEIQADIKELCARRD